jgi:hypothetical protein
MAQPQPAFRAPDIDTSLLDVLPADLQRVVQESLGSDESVEIALKGAFKEVLVATNLRVMVLKSGIMTGHLFGSDVFQIPYSAISGVQVQMGVINGYFEVTTPGMPSEQMSLWDRDPAHDPNEAPNCVAFIGRSAAERFQRACTVILGRVQGR